MVTADLWLIDAVAATLSPEMITRVAQDSRIRSVVENKGMRSSQAVDLPDDGYVTNRRSKRSQPAKEATLVKPLVTTPAGGMLLLYNDGSLGVLDSSGFALLHHTLEGGNFLYPPAVASDGTFFVNNAERDLYGFNVDGSLRWHVELTGNEKFTSGSAAINGVVYVVTDHAKLNSFSAADGKLLWHEQLDARHAGTVVGSPVVGADGTIYVATQGTGKTAGHLFAFQPNGTLRWIYNANAGEFFTSIPQVTHDGMVVVNSHVNRIYAVTASGQLRYQMAFNDGINGEPLLASSGVLYVNSKNRTFAINADGSTRFVFTLDSGSFASGPSLSRDGSRLYVVRKEKRLYSLDALSGALQWTVDTINDITLAPAVQPNGEVVVVDDKGEVQLLTAQGGPAGVQVGSLDMAAQAVVASNANTAFIAKSDGGMLSVAKLPKQWNGRSDVASTDSKKRWDLTNPYAIDVGADVLHDTLIQGTGVTVAVLDSGIYFDSNVKSELGSQVQKLFLGQADFIEPSCEVVEKNGKQVVLGLQYDTYCFTDATNSTDDYGHGSHVAGSIWNQFTDATTNVSMGIAPQAHILSVRVLGDDGYGTYAEAIEGIQYVIQNKNLFNIRVLNISLSAQATTPYFVDPLNRAVEQAWANGIVVVAAAGNIGPEGETITVPGNDPYVITVGAVDSRRSPGYWYGDLLPTWSSTGPTADGFVKPDVLAPGSQIVSFMYNDPNNVDNSSYLVRIHPDYSLNTSFFRMNGTSMATAITSGVVALMLQAHPHLTPDQVKYRLVQSAKPALGEGEEAPQYHLLQQGMGRIWAPDAVLGDFPADARANEGMDILTDLASGWETEEELAQHYHGPVQKALSDDGRFYLYFVVDGDEVFGLGAVHADTLAWVGWDELAESQTSWNAGTFVPEATEGDSHFTWAGSRFTWAGSRFTWAGSSFTWAGSRFTWAGSSFTWAGSRFTWAGSRFTWAGSRFTWAGSSFTWAGSRFTWAGNTVPSSTSLNSTTWVNDDGTVTSNRAEDAGKDTHAVYLPTVKN